MTDYKNHVSEAAAQTISRWLKEPKFAEYRSELEKLIADQRWNDLEDAFFKTIEFGTGGIRGTTGIGSNRISKVTIGEATQALAQYIKELDPANVKAGIVIAYDTRSTSHEFSQFAAEVCAGNGVRALLFESFRSTPELSFAIRHLKAAAGIVISASHNPPGDNGFKAYLSDGGQLVPPHDKAIIERTRTVDRIESINMEEALQKGLIETIGSTVDEAYISAVLHEALGSSRDLNIVYSPLHGAGQTNTLQVLRRAGFQVDVVKEQMTPDGMFSTIESGKPNPEEKSANDLAVAQMLSSHADIAITNDPDADRIGVMVREGNQPVYLSGNQAAVLATEFALRKLFEIGTLTNRHYIAKTIVTTDMLKAIADKYGVRVYGDLLIGFKYIGELLLKKELTDELFVIGGEESYGLLKGDYARDKDGAAGALVLAEYAAELKEENKTLYGRFLELYLEYGLYLERLDTIVCPGAEGFRQMERIMQKLRSEPPAEVAGNEVTAMTDYLSLIKLDLATGEKSSVACNTSGDVIVLEFADERCRVTIRPSGTEPKLKLYVQWFCESRSDIEAVKDQVKETNEVMELLSKELERALLTY